MATVAALRHWLPIALTGMLALQAQVLGQRPPEYQVKAAYLYGFGQFVEWPPAAPAAADRAFVLCVLGADPFGHWLDEVAADGVLNDKPVDVRRISRVGQSEPCHMLFISGSENARLSRTLEDLGRRPVLTVSDTPRFAERGGMIGFFLDGNRIRFTVNLTAAQEAGLQLNSELLRVAASIVRNPPGD